MSRLSLFVVIVVLISSHALAGEVTLNGRTFTLPTGLTLELAAKPPLVDRPIVADFDERGRLYVADSSGSNDKVEKQLAERPHRIVRLEDTDNDGVFDRGTIFADKMMFPEGTMWYDGSLYVAAPPSIWKLTDTDDDGVADQRVEWFKGKTLTGCANDLHGPYLGRDGWIYWCKGAFAKQTYERVDLPPFITRAAHIFRCRPDGTGLEPVMTGGMDNPVDVVFTPGGERIFTTTFLQHPGDGKRDGLIHAIYGGVYGKVHDVIEGHPRTGPSLMPALAHLGAAAPAGLQIYESNGISTDSVETLFACNFNLSKVTIHNLVPRGSTFEASTRNFLASTDRDFHPTDVIEDADGSLLVVDTGGWYKLCCPTSQLPKPDVLGAIYRVRFDSHRVRFARGQDLKWDTLRAEDLTDLLRDNRNAVRRRAIEALAKLGSDAFPALEEATHTGPIMENRAAVRRRAIERAAIGRVPGIVLNAKAARSGMSLERTNAVWTATRIDDPQARLLAQTALGDPHPTVRQAALHSISLWRDRTAVKLVLEILKAEPSSVDSLVSKKRDASRDDHVLQNQRAAAEALGRIGDKSAVPAILDVSGKTTDRVLEHSLTYALIEIADPKATAIGLASGNVRTQRAALIALDQMAKGGLEPNQVIPFLTSSDIPMREAASWIAGRHPEWAGALAGFLRDRLGSENLLEAEQAQLGDQLAKFAHEPVVQQVLADASGEANAPSKRRIALRAMAQSGVKVVPEGWVQALRAILSKSDDRAILNDALTCAQAFSTTKAPPKALSPLLIALGEDARLAENLRLDALMAVPGEVSAPSPALFAFLRRQLDPGQPVAPRMASATVLSRSRLSLEQLAELLETVKAAGPLEIDRLLTAFESTRDEAIGLKLVEVLSQAGARTSLRVEMLKPRFDKFGDRVRAEASTLYAALNVDAPAQKAKLEALLPTLTDGDIRRGQAVFNGPKAACLACHAIGYLGGTTGPDLSRIGQLRSDRDLMESILFPSLSFVRSYEPVTIATKAGRVVNGLLKSDSADEVALAVNATEVVRIPRAEIEEMRPGSVSVMPAGLDQQLSRQELADLLAFLKSRK